MGFEQTKTKNRRVYEAIPVEELQPAEKVEQQIPDGSHNATLHQAFRMPVRGGGDERLRPAKTSRGPQPNRWHDSTHCLLKSSRFAQTTVICRHPVSSATICAPMVISRSRRRRTVALGH
jgi:hypothetical protein